ncbi:MAG TPA: CpsB/CapC family capsule biosynthesis tyrosine phosphatase [Terriglobales bacterium]
MVDIHCHILPAIDDGPDSWEMTAKMCRLAALDGITHIVATPHCDAQFDYDREHFTDMLATLSEVANGRLTFSIGCDFHISPHNVADAMADPQRFAIGDSQYLLVEFDHHGIPSNASELLMALISRGMVPIITHPERNAFLIKHPETVLRFVESGCLVQVTANAFTGFWGPKSRKAAEWLLHRDAIHVVASDAHDLNLRPPVLSEAHDRVSALAGVEAADALVTHNPAAIVAGQHVPFSPARR